ncbi:MAG: hypothetical protein LUG61_08910 [Lachnospiraceae bacterium]|nr:hypothetical protein [Lachnospiraceae bacterium]
MFIKTTDDEFWNLEQAQCIYANGEGEIKMVYPEGKAVVLQKYADWNRAQRVLWDMMEYKDNAVSVFVMPEK